MQQIFKYIRSFYEKEFNLFYLLIIIAILAAIIYLNYWHGLEKKYAASGKTWLANFTGYYFLYLIPFAVAFFLQLLFFKDCSYYKSGWFWCILLLAPAFFSFRVNFTFHQPLINDHWQAPENLFYLRSINWVVRVFVVLIPVFIIWWLKDKANQPFYGTKKLESIHPYLIMLLIMIPLLLLAAAQKDFQSVYPKAKFLQTIPAKRWQYFVYELCYGFDFISIEFFFRGFLILALAKICGTHCIIPVACFYCSIHLGKPMGEAISSFWGGLLLGIVSYNTGSIWGGLIVHLGIAWLMELFGWLAMLKLPL
ncbi:MAG: CPBP family intramembrane glutamic endopeptidase [Bacteroidota bacterium]